MAVRYWAPATLYQPNDVVQENRAPGITVLQPNNADFEAGNVDWTLDA